MSDRRRFTLALLISGALIGLSAWSCVRTGPSGHVEVHVGAPASDEECLQVARAFEAAVDSGDFSAFAKLLDWDVLVEQAVRGVAVSAKDHQPLRKILKGSEGPQALFARFFEHTVADEGSCKFLRMRAEGDQKRAVFRLVAGDGQHMYHELLLARRPAGHVRIIDIFMNSRGERVTDMLRRGLMYATPEMAEVQLRKLGGWAIDLREHYPTIRDLISACKKGQHSEVLRLFEQLPPVLRKEKDFLHYRLAAAQEVGGDELLAAVEDLRANHPDDPLTESISIGYFRTKKQFGNALAVVDRMEKVVGRDPYLLSYRAGIHLEAGDHDAAREQASKAIEEEPALESAYWTLIDVALTEKQFDEVVKLLNSIAKRFGDNFDDLAQLPEYAEFVKSPQYQQWLKSRTKM